MAIPDRYKKMGFPKLNVCKKSKRPGKKMMVLIKDGEKYRVLHFGDESMGHNYSHAARQSCKARHGKNRTAGHTSAE